MGAQQEPERTLEQPLRHLRAVVGREQRRGREVRVAGAAAEPLPRPVVGVVGDVRRVRLRRIRLVEPEARFVERLAQRQVPTASRVGGVELPERVDVDVERDVGDVGIEEAPEQFGRDTFAPGAGLSFTNVVPPASADVVPNSAVTIVDG